MCSPTSAAPTTTDRLGISTVCFRNVDLASALEEITNLNVTAVDLAALRGLCEHVSPDAEPAALRAAAHTVTASGVTPVALNVDPQSFDEQDADVVLGRIRRLIDFCVEIGCPTMILPCGSTGNRDTATAETLTGIADGLLRAADAADGSGVAITVEAPHHFRVVHDLDRSDQLIAQLYDRVGLVFDTSHVRAAGANPAQAFTARHRGVRHVQLRDAVTGDIRRAIGHGDIDFGQFLAATERQGYRGHYILELETHNSPYPNKRDEVTAGLALMRRTLLAHNMIGSTLA